MGQASSPQRSNWTTRAAKSNSSSAPIRSWTKRRKSRSLTHLKERLVCTFERILNTFKSSGWTISRNRISSTFSRGRSSFSLTVLTSTFKRPRWPSTQCMAPRFTRVPPQNKTFLWFSSIVKTKLISSMDKIWASFFNRGQINKKVVFLNYLSLPHLKHWSLINK